MVEHNELNPNESEARSRCCPIHYYDRSEELQGENFRYELEKEITVQRNTTLRKWLRIPNLHRGSIQVYLEPEDTPYIKISDLTLYEIKVLRDTDWDALPHQKYYIDLEKVEEFESGEVIEIPSDCGCGYEVFGDIEIFVPNSVALHTLDVKMVIDTGARSKREIPFKLVII